MATIRTDLIIKINNLEDIHVIRSLNYLMDHLHEKHVIKLSFEELIILSQTFRGPQHEDS